MDGAYEMSAAPLLLEIDGQQWVFAPLDDADEGAIEAEMLKTRPKPLQAVQQYLSTLGEADRRVLLELAYRDEMRGPMVPWYEVKLWELSRTGAVYVAFLRLRHNHPDITTAKARDLLKRIGVDSLAAYKATDGRPRGNSQAPAEATGANGHANGVSPGGPSAEGSPPISASDLTAA
jgi:hypothetical protein